MQPRPARSCLPIWEQGRSRRRSAALRSGFLGTKLPRVSAKATRVLKRKIFNEQNALLDKRIGIEQRINAILQLQRQALHSGTRRPSKRKSSQSFASKRRSRWPTPASSMQERRQVRRSTSLRNGLRPVKPLKQIATKGFQQKDFDVAKALGLGDFLQKIQSDVTQRPIQITFHVENAIKKFKRRCRSRWRTSMCSCRSSRTWNLHSARACEIRPTESKKESPRRSAKRMSCATS
jgi:hypothetical protein